MTLRWHLENLSVSFYTVLSPLLILYGYPVLVFMFYIHIIPRTLVILYIVYTYLTYDRNFNGGYKSNLAFVRKYRKLVKSYFPGKCVMLGKMPADTKPNLLLGMHPHGVYADSFFFLLEESDDDFKQYFEGYKSLGFTMNANIMTPLQRDYMLAMGCASVTEKSMMHWLTHPAGGRLGILVVGGLREALFCPPSNGHEIVLNTRKGFCRVALQSGAWLLPSYTFGQNEVVGTVRFSDNSWLRKVQYFIYDKTGMTAIVTKASWISRYVPMMSRRRPLTLVMGEPIPVEKVEKPTKEQIDALHEKYVQGLRELFNSQKSTYLSDKNAELKLL